MGAKVLAKQGTRALAVMFIIHLWWDFLPGYIWIEKNRTYSWPMGLLHCLWPQRAHDVIITSSLRPNDVADVVSTLSLRHYRVMCPLGHVKGMSPLWPLLELLSWYYIVKTSQYNFKHRVSGFDIQVHNLRNLQHNFCHWLYRQL